MFAVFSLCEEEKDLTLEFMRETLSQRNEIKVMKEDKVITQEEVKEKDEVEEKEKMVEDKSLSLKLFREKLGQRNLEIKPSLMNEQESLKEQHTVYTDPTFEVRVDIPSSISITPTDKNLIPEIHQGGQTGQNTKNRFLHSIIENKTRTQIRKIGRPRLKTPREVSGICKDCGEFKKALYNHRKLFHDTSVSTCDLCSRQFQTKDLLRRHKRRSHKPPSPCPDCGKMVKRMEQHRLTQHTENQDKKWRCQTCGKGFAIKEKLTDHVRIHGEKMFPCRVSNGLCGRAAASNGNRRKHEALCKYWEKLEDKKNVKTEEKKNIECKEDVREEVLELDM